MLIICERNSRQQQGRRSLGLGPIRGRPVSSRDHVRWTDQRLGYGRSGPEDQTVRHQGKLWNVCRSSKSVYSLIPADFPLNGCMSVFKQHERRERKLVNRYTDARALNYSLQTAASRPRATRTVECISSTMIRGGCCTPCLVSFIAIDFRAAFHSSCLIAHSS